MKERICIKCGVSNKKARFKVKNKKERNVCAECFSKQKKKNDLQVRYGITMEDYEQRVLAQDGKCLICLTIPDILVVDHDHKTEHVRGLLCNNCNRGIGLLKDNIEVLQSAIDYLRKYE